MSVPIDPNYKPLPYNAGPARSLEAVTLSDMVEAIRPCDTDIWRSRFLTRTFWLRWCDTPARLRGWLLEDEPRTLGDERWDALIAGWAHELSRRYRLDPPGWALKPDKYLDHVWTFGRPRKYRLARSVISPAPFLLEHGILREDYEMVSAQRLAEGWEGWDPSSVTWRSPSWGDADRALPGCPTPQTALDAFELIARRFEEIGVKAGFYLSGGSAFEMARATETYSMTMSLEQLDEAGHREAQKAISETADANGWPEDWLSMLPVPPIDEADPVAVQTLFYHPHLGVFTVSPLYLAGMLLLSGRAQDSCSLARVLSHAPDVRTMNDLVGVARRLAPDTRCSNEELKSAAVRALSAVV